MPKVIDVPGYGPTEFPDNMSDDDIVKAIQKNMVPAASSMRGTTGSFKAGTSGTWEQPSGFKRGFLQDPIAGLQQLGAETEIAGFVAPEWAKNKRAELQQQEAQYQRERALSGDAGVDWPRLGGQVLSPVNLGIAALTKTPPGASLPTRMAAGGLAGGLMGGTAPVYGNATREGQMGAGTVGGVVAAPLTGAGARVVKPKVDPNVALLRAAGVTPTIGQSMGGAFKATEDKAMSLPLLGDAIYSARKAGLDKFQSAGYNRALAPIGEKASGKTGFAGMTEVHNKLSQAYDDVIPKLSFKPDAQFAQDTAALRAALGNLPAKEQKYFDEIIANVNSRATPQGNMSGETFKNVESTIGEKIKQFATDPSYEKQQIADALKSYREYMREGLQRSNPMFAPRLQKINEGWANYAILRDAASGAQAAKNEGMFTPAQLAAGVRTSAKRQGQAVGKGKLSEGKALMQDLANAGQQVLPSQYPDSGTAGRVALGALGGLAVGGTPYTLGTLGALGGASLPYLPGVRKGADVLMNARPQSAEAIAELIRAYPGLLAPAAPLFVNSFQNK